MPHGVLALGHFRETCKEENRGATGAARRHHRLAPDLRAVEDPFRRAVAAIEMQLRRGKLNEIARRCGTV